MAKKNIHILLSVQTKIILITILIITVVLGAFAYYEVERKRKLLIAEVNELAVVTASKLTNNLRIPLWDLDVELVEDTITSEMLTRDISAVLVIDSNGVDLVSGKQRSANWEVLNIDSEYQLNPEYEVMEEVYIKEKNENIGRVKVYATKRFKMEELQSSTRGLLITLLLLDITLLLVLWLVMSHIIRKPINALSELANKISMGHLDVEVDTSRNDEIGVVAKSIDRLKVSLRISIERLRRIEIKRQEAIKARKKLGAQNV